ncbi:MmcQ/YjbR family DNA-binding protein [bacterium]|nr:MmcQ/YjbR family DNA-binding protein [bacterium]MCI0602231.1 MmcQ/YjbR family DNA-binding protein [bacterium]
MKLEDIRKYCLSLPHTTENVQWGNDLVFKVAGKMFTVCDLEGSKLSFKTTPDEFQELILVDGIAPAEYVARYHWVTVHKASALRNSELKRLINDSYQMVVDKLPKKVREKLTK